MGLKILRCSAALRAALNNPTINIGMRRRYQILTEHRWFYTVYRWLVENAVDREVYPNRIYFALEEGSDLQQELIQKFRWFVDIKDDIEHPTGTMSAQYLPEILQLQPRTFTVVTDIKLQALVQPKTPLDFRKRSPALPAVEPNQLHIEQEKQPKLI